MNKEEIKEILNKLNIKYVEYEYELGQSGIQLEEATSYIRLLRCDTVSLYFAGIYLYFDKDDKFILIEATE